MTSRSKAKGNSGEREFQRIWQEVKDFATKRGWGSNGEAMGMHREVDVAVYPDPYGTPIRFQVKRKKKMPLWAKIEKDEVDAVAFREDRGEWYVLLPLDDYMRLF